MIQYILLFFAFTCFFSYKTNEFIVIKKFTTYMKTNDFNFEKFTFYKNMFYCLLNDIDY